MLSWLTSLFRRTPPPAAPEATGPYRLPSKQRRIEPVSPAQTTLFAAPAKVPVTEFKPVAYRWLDGNLEAPKDAAPELLYKPTEEAVVAQPVAATGAAPAEDPNIFYTHSGGVRVATGILSRGWNYAVTGHSLFSDLSGMVVRSAQEAYDWRGYTNRTGPR